MDAIVPAQGCPACALLAEQVKLLREQVSRLEEQVRQLQARLDQDSSNSHKPPSSDPPWARKPSPKKPTGKRPGGQPGHEGHHRQRLPPDRIDRYVDYVPSHCGHCRAALPQRAGPAGAEDPPPSWHQVAELPPLAAVVTEHRGHARTCRRCGKLTRAAIPKDVRAHVIGPRLAAAMSYLAGRCHDGRRTVAEVVEDLFGVPLSLGSVCNYESQTAAALARAHDQALAAVRSAAVKHVDETGWKRAGKRRWLWTATAFGTATTRTAACFAVQAKRSWRAACDLLGRRGGRGVITSDRHRLYDPLGVRRRQVCWAHLKRDFVKWQEKSDQTRLLGDDGLELCKNLFALWRDFRERKLSSRPALQRSLRPLRRRLGQILRWGKGCGDPKAANFCRNLLKLGPALWTFARVEGVEPTNNPAERALRAAVLWRKNSFGCHGEGGCRFVERMLTAVQTLRLQGRNVLRFLCDTLTAHRQGLPLPALTH